MSDQTMDRADLEASFASNQRLWDAWTKVHAEGEFYDVAGFREGGVSDPAVRDRGARRRHGQDPAPPAMPLRPRHPVLGAPRREGHRRRLLACRDRPRARAGRRHRVPRRSFHRVEHLPAAAPARRRVRHRLHLTRRAGLAARHPGLGEGRRSLRQAGWPVLHLGGHTRSSRCSRARACPRASCGCSTRIGSMVTR